MKIMKNSKIKIENDPTFNEFIRLVKEGKVNGFCAGVSTIGKSEALRSLTKNYYNKTGIH